jgi:hypothetical protein
MWKAITDQYKTLRAEGVFLNIPTGIISAAATSAAWATAKPTGACRAPSRRSSSARTCSTAPGRKPRAWVGCSSRSRNTTAAARPPPSSRSSEHLPHYEARFANLLGFGVQACYRGPRLFDSEETKALVKKWVSFYKQHRDVLDNGDIIHLRRANGRDWDGILHANPAGSEKGLACLYNPLTEDITREIRLPLHYTGLREKARLSVDGGESKVISLDPSNHALLKVSIPAQGRTFLLFTE